MVAGYEHMDAMSKNHRISFPDGTGIAIGAQSPYKYAVIEVHNNMPIKQDASGFRLEYSPGTPPKQITQDRLSCPDEGQLIPPLRPSFKFGCVGYDWTAAEDAHVVLLHFHFHGLGKQISYAVQHADGSKTPGAVWFVAGGKDADAVGTNIGAGVTHHKTVTLETPLTLKHGDKMLIECEYDTTHKKTPTKFGPSSDDEMCNIFFAYYSDSGKLLADDFPDGGSDPAIATVSDLRSHDGPRSKFGDE